MAQPNKALIALVIGMGVVILLCFGALIAGLFFKASAPKVITLEGDERNNAIKKNIKSVTSQLGKISLPAGYLIKNIGLSNTQIIIHASQKTGAGRVFVIDGETGAVLRRFEIGTAP